MMIRKHKISGAIVLIALGVFLRAYIAYVIRPVNGDSAVFALMAKHISELKEFYIYMPLAHYAGALSSYIAAAFFKGFGISYNSFITAGLIFSSAGLVAGCVLSRRILDGFGELISNLLIAAPSFLMIRYSLLTGVHAENVLFIPMLLLIAVKMNANGGKHSALFAGMSGFISGIALWATPSSVPAVLTIMTVLIIGRRREAFRGAALFLIGMLIGYAPGIIYDFQYPNASLFRMAGRILNLDRSALSAPGLPMLIFRQVCWRISTVPESICRIPRLTAELITFPGMLLFLASMIIVFAARLRGAMGRHRLDGMGVVLLYAVWFVIFYSFLVGEPAARYMIPLAIISPFMIGDALSGVSKFAGKLLIVILAAALVYINVMTVKNSAQAYSSERYMLLNEWLVKNDVTSGYSDYDTAYISEFLAFGKVMISPTLFSPTFADRWPDETNSVRNSTRVCYIIDSKRYGRMIEPFKNNLDRLGIVYRKYRVNDFEAYLDIPPAVQPDSIMPKMREDGRR